MILSFLGTLLAFLIVFSVIVFVHEFGHFFMGKLAGIRVEVFSFGLGQRLFGFKKGHTDYRVSLVPMGGYVKFLGEGVAGVEAGKVLEPDDFMAKARWKRFLVIAMGAVMNILLAVVLLAVVNMIGVNQPEFLNESPVIGWIEPGSPAAKASLQPEDEILSINGRVVNTWSDVEIAVSTQPEKLIRLEILREGQRLPVDLRTEKRTRYEMGYAGFFGKILTQVMMVKPNSPAEKAGLEPGDVVVEIEGQPVYFYKFVETLEKNPGKPLRLLVSRNGNPLELTVTPREEGKVGKIGILQTAKSVKVRYGFFAAIGQSVVENLRYTTLVIDFLKKLFSGEASTRQVSGPIDIASVSYAALRMGFVALISLIALFSLQLGIINLLPIPVLDGGQLFVLLLEGISRRDLKPKLRQIWMQFGFVIFIALVVFAITNDIVKRLPHGWKSLIPF